MFLDGDIDRDSTMSDDFVSRGWAITLGVCMLPIYLAFSMFGLVGKGSAASVAVGTLALTVKMHAGLKRQWWFWCVMATAAVASVFLITFVPLPNQNYTFAIVAPFGYAYYLLIRLAITTVQRRAKVS